jgi:hypothetical protein
MTAYTKRHQGQIEPTSEAQHLTDSPKLFLRNTVIWSDQQSFLINQLYLFNQPAIFNLNNPPPVGNLQSTEEWK